MGLKDWAERNKPGGVDQVAASDKRKAEKDVRAQEKDVRAQEMQEKAEERRAKAGARAEAQSEKARAKAQKQGVNVDGALFVAHTFADRADRYLVLFPDRIEHVNRGTGLLLVGKGAGTESIPISRVSSAECRNEGIASRVDVYTSGNSITFKTDQITGPVLRQAILDLIARQGAAPSADAASAAPDVTDQLRKIGELHAAGILTDAEFSAKKTELLDRL